ncbi:hypothetical protein [Flavobacterium sp. RSP15]|uniref:hypothetical protein n=1 Tax=Flavobacterium sp. RSP15 TaxID=2497485 RepID=UPI000F8204E6|nr:hypothetical protein [Flavobacterium sp. RSP15]RTY88104.1 hypothetical protein EKM00_02845 [Flavobacterium sp. RSP15]
MWKSNEEQMLYDYKSKSIKQLFSTSLEELDFEINSIEKIGGVKSSDSIKILKDKLVLAWLGKDAVLTEKDTLTFNYVIKELNKLTNTYQEIILGNIRNDEEYKNYEYKEKRNENIKISVYAGAWKSKFDLYSKNPDSIISTKYKVSYSLTNPLLKIKQTHDEIYFTNADQTKFIFDEKVEVEK